MGGNTTSVDIVTYNESAVVIAYDEVDFRVLWAREFKCRNYGGRATSVSHIVLDLSHNEVFIAFRPLVIVKMKVDTGDII